MAGVKLAKGAKVKARVHHNGVKAGTEGTITAVYNGTYYAVNYPGVPGVCYSPDPHVIPTADPDAGSYGPTSGAGGAPTPAAASVWSRLMESVVGK
jgi:hypothetical protein